MNRSIRWMAMAAIAVTFLTACLSKTSSITRPTPSQGGKPPALANSGQAPTNLAKCAVGATNEPLQFFGGPKMTSPATGWALGQCALGSRPSFPNGSTINCFWPDAESMGILRTSDGGATWTDVSPPSVANRTFHHAQFFLDATHAWVTEASRTADACVNQLTTFMTSDGGNTWRQGGTFAVKTTTPTDDVFNVSGPINSMDFTDLQHGWILVGSWPQNPQPGSTLASATVYATSDGGTHWRLVATNPGKAAAGGAPACQSSAFYAPASDAVFSSSADGWLAVSCPNLEVLTTHDGGATWSSQPLPNCNCNVYQAQFFDAGHAIVTSPQGSSVMLATVDAGASWQQRQVPAAASTDFYFTDPNDGWMVGIEQLPKSYDTVVYRTTDGGQTWSLLGRPGFTNAGSSPNDYYPIVGLQFLDSNVGFVVLGSEAGTNGQTDPSLPTLQVLSTKDAGRTWTAVLKQIPAAPCSAQYRQGNYGQGGVLPAKMASPTTAWAQGGLRSTDGGAHWQDVSPSALREGNATPLYPPGYAEFYLDGDHAWQAGVYGSKTSCADHVTTFATTDGGKTWQPSAPVALNLPKGDAAFNLQLGFTSALAGWLWVPIGPGTGDPFGSPATDAILFATTDGGLSWRQVARLTNAQLQHIPTPAGSQNCTPGLGQITFSSPSVGWLSLNCADPGTLVTRDGGVTWKSQSIVSAGCQCSPGALNFVDASHGFVQTYGNNAPDSSLIATSDAGATWQVLPALPSGGFLEAIDFADAGNLFLLMAPPGCIKFCGGNASLYRSSDGGRTWSLVQGGLPIGRPNALLFSDEKHGMVAQPRNATMTPDNPAFSNANDTVILVTSDGGHTWRTIKPAIGT